MVLVKNRVGVLMSLGWIGSFYWRTKARPFMNQSIFKYPQGAQLTGARSVLLLIPSAFMGLMSLVLLAQSFFILSLILLSIVAFCLIIAADVRGLEIDPKNSCYRQYRIRPWGKRGKWEPYSGYSILKLDLDTYRFKGVVDHYGSRYGGDGYTNPHHCFTLEIIKPESEESIFITEKSDYPEAKKLLLKIAKELNLQPIDSYQERLFKAKRRRANRRYLS